MNRRNFLKSAMATGAGLTILPSGARSNPASNKLNVAMIGVWGRGLAHYGSLKDENIVALCDINENHLADAAKKYPNAKTYVDWRKCLEQKDIDAVICCTADHTHAFIANWCLNRNLHCYMEKPLAISVEEARVVRDNYRTKNGKIATQVGMQRHADTNFNRIKEMIRDGAIGELKSAYAWGNRQIRRGGYLPAEGEPPSHLHYDLWLGPAPYHPYNAGYFKGGPGANCLEWNMFWDFGAGQIGDMGSHTMDLLWNAVDTTLPTTAEAKGEEFNADVTPVELEMHFDNPANEWRPAIKVSWYQGGAMPKSPRNYIDLNRIGHGAMFKGSEGFLISDFTTRLLIPHGRDANMSYYKPRKADEMLPPVGHFQHQWIKACKEGTPTACDFEYSANMIEQMLLGLVAYRAGKKLEYDPDKGVVTNDSSANAFLKRTYREGWTLNG